MTRLRLPAAWPAATVAALALAAGCASAAPGPASQQPPTRSEAMQGDQASWIADPHMHAFYELTVGAFAAGPAAVDEAAYRQKAFAIFRDFAVSRGIAPEHMVEHLKLIPAQVIQIVREDPSVLASYSSFTDAVFGPP